MLDSIKVGNFIMEKRKSLGMTQQQLADKLNISFQAISKWENGTTYPNIELLRDLAIVLDVSVDEILAGSERDVDGLSYSKAGIDITYTDTICHDMINHLVNDIVVMGATPLAVLDTIVCGNAEKDTIKTLVKGVSDACKENECSLVGGETSIQPLVVDAGVYVLTSSIAGIVEKSKVIDGSAMEEGDVVLAIASNGLHTNGYSLVRLLMDKMPQIKLDKIDGLTFIEQIMKPHTPYYKSIKGLFDKDVIHGMAHITGGGIEGNLCRVIPEGLSAKIDLSKLRILNLFKYIRNNGNISDEEMLRTFNCGVGFNVVVVRKDKDEVMNHINQFYDCYEIGTIEKGSSKVKFENRMNWL